MIVQCLAPLIIDHYFIGSFTYSFHHKIVFCILVRVYLFICLVNVVLVVTVAFWLWAASFHQANVDAMVCCWMSKSPTDWLLTWYGFNILTFQLCTLWIDQNTSTSAKLWVTAVHRIKCKWWELWCYFRHVLASCAAARESWPRDVGPPTSLWGPNVSQLGLPSSCARDYVCTEALIFNELLLYLNLWKCFQWGEQAKGGLNSQFLLFVSSLSLLSS